MPFASSPAPQVRTLGSGGTLRRGPARRFSPLVLAIVLGFSMAAMAVALANLAMKPLLLTLFVLAIVPLAAVTRQAKAIVLIAWILSIAYYRVIFPIESMAGFQGFYVNISDGVFLIAMTLWFYDVVVARRSLTAYGPPLVRFALPLLFVCFVSALLAQRSDWALYEVVRVAKIPLIILYCRYNLGPKEWWVCVGALGLSVVAQSTFAVLQLAGILGHYQIESFDQEIRPNGTLGHASLMAGYMLLLLPLFLGLAACMRRKGWKLVCFGVSLMAYVAVGLTLSRMPWLISGLEAGALLLVLVASRMLSLKRAIAIGSISLILVGLALIPFYGRILKRINGDVDASISWRLEMIQIGFNVFQKHSFFGIGLANFPLYLQGVNNIEFSDSLDLAMQGVLERPSTEVAPVKGFHWVWVPHNIYVLLLVETGMFGLCSFLLLLGAGFRAGLRALRTQDEVLRGASIGLMIGMCGVLAQMLTDWAMWLDPVLYTFVISMCLLNNRPEPFTKVASTGRCFGTRALRTGRPIAYR